MPKGVKRDLNLDNPAVRSYKDIIHLQLNYLQRQFVVESIPNTPRGLRIWQAVLTERMLKGCNPKNVPDMVKQWANVYYDPARSDPCWEDRSNEQVAETWRD